MKIHSDWINSLKVFPGICITGSSDWYVRVWPLDFSEFHLEAEFEKKISEVSVCFDGIKIAIGGEEYLGILNLNT